MKDLNITNLTLKKIFSPRAVRVCTSGGAYIEHPLSIYSAYIGTSRKTGGNKVNLAMKVAAMIMLLLSLGVGNAWAGSASTQARAYLKDGSPTGSGKVYIEANDATAPTDNKYTTCTTAGTTKDGTSGTSKKSTFYFYAQANSGYKFTGWYKKNSDDSFTLVTTDASWSGSVTSPSAEPSVGTSYTYLDRYAEFIKVVNYSFVVPEHGSFTITNNGSPVANYATFEAEGVVHVSATPAEGYRFGGWYTTTDGGTTRKYFAFTSETDLSFSDDATIGADFRLDNGDALFSVVNGGLYDNLNSAASAASSVSPNIVLVAQDGILRGGDYTIPSGVSLLVPYNKETSIQKTPEIKYYSSPSSVPAISAYRTLVMEDGANITCNGTICVAGQVTSLGGGNKSAYVSGPCGVINMANGGHIELNDGAKLYCWGFVKGQDMNQGNNTQDVGTITANDGATIYQDFEVGDWRGGSATSNIYNNGSSYKLFPFQSYSIQNVEVPTTYKYGSILNTYVVVNGNGGDNPASFDIIGNENTLFLLKDAQSTIRMWYDPTTDLTCYELSGTAQLDALNITVYISISSGSYYLPISNSMHIILTNCNMTLSKPMTMQAGSVIEIKADATANLEARLHMYDKDEWGLYIHNYYFRSFNNLTNHKNRGAENSKAGLEDAKLIVDGTLNVVDGKGYLYTTAGGANIMGNGGGKVVFGGALPSSSDQLYQALVTGSSPYVTYESNTIDAANLCNEDGSYTKSIASTTFHNINGRWFAASAKEEKADHTYDFTYISAGQPVSGTSGTTTTTDAVYSNDKTGLETRMKWANVTADACADWWQGQGTQSGWFYNYSLSSAWHQFIPMEAPLTGWYSGSNNKLYTKDDCSWGEVGAIDEECFYTHEGVKKALANGNLIPLTKNTKDEAWHNTAEAEEYYICFEGCTWHSATKYSGQEKAYIVEGGNYIWYNGDWKLVEREEPFFFDYNDQHVKRYYEYEEGEWVLATPCARVTTTLETQEFYFFLEAFNHANKQAAATITLLRDVSGITSAQMAYTKANGNCTLDLNNHTISGTVSGSSDPKMLHINASGATFTITDNSEEKGGRLVMTKTGRSRYYNTYVQKGNLVLENGTIYTDCNKAGTQISGWSSTDYQNCHATCIKLDGGTTFTMTGGKVEAEACGTPYAIYSEATTTVGLDIQGGIVISNATKYQGAACIYFSAAATSGGAISSGKFKALGTSPVGAINSTLANTAFTISGGFYNVNSNLAKYAQTNYHAVELPSSHAEYANDYRYEVVESYPVTWYDYDGTELATAYARGNQTIEARAYPSVVGYTYTGWYKESEHTNAWNFATDVVTGELRLYAGRTINTHTITWNTNGGELVGEGYTIGTVAYGTPIVAPEAVKGTQAFAWTPAVAATMPDNDLTYTATWSTAQASVTAGGVTVYYSTIDKAMTAAAKKRDATIKLLANISRDNSTADANNGGGCLYFNSDLTDNTCVLDLNSKTVTINANTPKTDADIANPSLTINAPGTTFTLKNGTLSNGRSGRSRYTTMVINQGNVVIENATVSVNNSVISYTVGTEDALKIKACAIRMEGGSLTVKSGTIQCNATYNPYTIWVRSGASATIEGGTINASTNRDNNPYALYVDGGTVNVTGGTINATSATTGAYALYLTSAGTGTISGGKLKATASSGVGCVNNTATASNLSIIGGYYNINTNLATYVSSPYRVHATTASDKSAVGSAYNYKVNNEYTITWDAVTNGGACATAYTTKTYEQEIGALPNATKGHYTLVGWFTESTGGTQISEATPVTADVTYCAQFSPNTHALAWNFKGGTPAGTYTEAGDAIAYGTSIVYPTLTKTGYTFVSWSADDSTMPDNDLTITASWTPNTNTPYVVKHYKQNLDGSYPAEPTETDNLTGTTETEVTPAVKSYTGFTAPSTQIVTILADGSLVVVYQYVRKSHTLTWNANGGVLSGEYTNGTVAYGTTIVAPTVSREGYIFNGWNTTPASTMPDNDLTYTASWTAATASVTVPGGEPVYYTSLSSAWSAANGKAECTIKLFKNVTGLGASALVYTKANGHCTLDLNNHTISGAVSSASDPKVMYINASGCTFTITDNSDAKGGRFTMTMGGGRGAYCAVQVAQGTLVMAGGTIYSESSRAWVTSDGSTYSFQADAVRLEAGTSFQMTGGTAEAKSQIAPKAIYAKGNNNITISGGTLIATSTIIASGAPNSNPTALYIAGGTTTITGGTFVAITKTNVVNTIYATDASQTVTISGGKFKATGGTSMANINNATAAANVSIQGGYYSHNTNLSKYKATGYQVKGTTAADKASVGNEYNYKLDNLYTITWQLDGVTVRTDEVAYGVTPDYGESPQKDMDNEHIYTFNEWSPEVVAVTGDATYTATFTQTARPYTITWNNVNGTLLANSTSYWGLTPAYPDFPNTPTYTDAENHLYRFTGWYPEVHAVNSDENIYTAQYELVTKIDVTADETIAMNTTVTTTTVHVAGALHVSANLKTDDLILEGSANEAWTTVNSGSIDGADNITATNVYYDLSPEGGFKAGIWYAVAVPWVVDVPSYQSSDVYAKNGDAITSLVMGTQFDLLYYDGESRAANGISSANWKLVEDLPNKAEQHKMVPGKAYMIYLATATPTLRFKKSSGNLLTNSLTVNTYEAGNTNDANWNGIANPALYHAYLNAGTDGNKGQVFVPGSAPRDGGSYEPLDMENNKLVVGQPIFVQAETNDKSVVAYTSNTEYGSHAPRRVQGYDGHAEVDYAVEIAKDGAFASRIYVQAADEKEDSYTIGKDVSKMGVSTTRAQMWINCYGQQLCVNTQEWTNNAVIFPLTIFAPQSGEYEISVPSGTKNGDNLFLTYDGRVMWNLSYVPYPASLEKGTNTHYGLKLVRSNMPTDIEQSAVSDQPSVQKIIMDNKVYILRGGELFTITGQKAQ